MKWNELREKLTLEKGPCSCCFTVPAGGPRVVFSLTNKGLGHPDTRQVFIQGRKQAESRD